MALWASDLGAVWASLLVGKGERRGGGWAAGTAEPTLNATRLLKCGCHHLLASQNSGLAPIQLLCWKLIKFPANSGWKKTHSGSVSAQRYQGHGRRWPGNISEKRRHYTDGDLKVFSLASSIRVVIPTLDQNSLGRKIRTWFLVPFLSSPLSSSKGNESTCMRSWPWLKEMHWL